MGASGELDGLGRYAGARQRRYPRELLGRHQSQSIAEFLHKVTLELTPTKKGSQQNAETLKK
jgi:hypothetical protein